MTEKVLREKVHGKILVLKKKYGKFQNLKENVRYNEDFWQKGN